MIPCEFSRIRLIVGDAAALKIRQLDSLFLQDPGAARAGFKQIRWVSVILGGLVRNIAEVCDFGDFGAFL